MSYQQIMGVMSLPPDPPRVNNNNYICIKYCPKGLDHLSNEIFESTYKVPDGIYMYDSTIGDFGGYSITIIKKVD